MTPVVSVPVLSLQRMSMLPKFWIAGRCLTMTWSRAIRSAPCVSVTDAIIGRKLRREPDAQGDREEKRFERIVLEGDPHEQNEQDQDDGRSQNQQAESPQSALELRLRLARPEPHGDVAEHRLRTRCRRDHNAGSADNRRAQKDEMRSVRPSIVHMRISGGRVLVGRQRLPRQHRLLNRKVPRLDQASVRRARDRRRTAG